MTECLINLKKVFVLLQRTTQGLPKICYGMTFEYFWVPGKMGKIENKISLEGHTTIILAWATLSEKNFHVTNPNESWRYSWVSQRDVYSPSHDADDGNLPEIPCTQNRIDFGFAISTTIITWTEISYKKNNKGQLNVPNLPTFLRQTLIRVLWTIRSTSTVSSDHRGHLECIGFDVNAPADQRDGLMDPNQKYRKEHRDFLHPMTRKLFFGIHYYKM